MLTRTRIRGSISAAVAGRIVGKRARDYAYKSGFYVLEQSVDTVGIAEPTEAWQPNTAHIYPMVSAVPVRGTPKA